MGSIKFLTQPTPHSSSRPFQRRVDQLSISFHLGTYSITKRRLKRRVVVVMVVVLHLHSVNKGWQLFLVQRANFDKESIGDDLEAQKILLF